MLLRHHEMLFFIDESNKDRVAARRRYGWALVGKQVDYRAPLNTDTRYTFLGAADCYGLVTSACDIMLHSIRGKEEHKPVDCERLVEYIRDKIVRHLGNYLRNEPRSVVVMDNCSVHTDPRVRQMIEAAGAILTHSAPYSPEVIPTEYMFSSWKAYLKRRASYRLYTQSYYRAQYSS